MAIETFELSFELPMDNVPLGLALGAVKISGLKGKSLGLMLGGPGASKPLAWWETELHPFHYPHGPASTSIICAAEAVVPRAS